MSTAFLFPGQGAQFVGMGKQIFDSFPQAQERFAEASEILGYNLATFCFEGPAEKLNTTEISQPALFVCGLAAVDQLRATSPEIVEGCSMAAGLSLGEYTALVFAEAIDFASGVRLVAERGKAMQAAADSVQSGMVSILGMEKEAIQELCIEASQGQVLKIANMLCPGNIVVSGEKAACERIEALANDAGAMKTIPLTVAGAFHTELMLPAVERLQDALENVEIRAPKIPVVSNVDARPHSNPEELRSLLLEQLVSPVLWESSMRWMVGDGKIEQFYELGSGRTLKGLLKRIDRKIPCENIGE